METIATTSASFTTTFRSTKAVNSWVFRSLSPCRTSIFSSRSPVRSRRLSLRRSSATTFCSLAEEAASDTATKVAEKESSLTVQRRRRRERIQKKAADISPDLKGTSIFLVGMNHLMKTSLGKLLADVLRYYYFDSDSLLFDAAGGESTAKSFRESDEKGYRESETEILRQLSSMGRLVVCAGDGAVQSSTNLALLRHGISIWIDAPLELVARGRAEEHSELPTTEVSDSGPLEVLPELVTMYKELREGYATADATISLQRVATQLGYDDLDSVTTEDLTMEVLKELERLIRVKKLMQEAARPF